MANWDKEMQKDAKESRDLMDTIKSTALHLTRVSLGQSADDFCWWSTIGNPAVNWSPFSFTQIVNISKRLNNLILGDHDFYKGVTNSFAATRHMKPLMEYIKPNSD